MLIGIMDLNMTYRNKIKLVEKRSLELGLDPRLDFKLQITTKNIATLQGMCERDIIQFLFTHFPAGYWGTQCLNIVPQTFAYLQYLQIPCELIFGEVNINGTDEFDTTLEGLITEYMKGYSGTGFAVHVWINVGKDYIIDPTISSRLNKYYNPNFPQNKVINGKASNLEKKMKLRYEPMLAGIKYLDVTCKIPLEYNVVVA